MLQELAAGTGATAWTIASMLFFVAVWLGVVVWVVGRRSEEVEAWRRLPLEEDAAPGEIRDRGQGEAKRGGA